MNVAARLRRIVEDLLPWYDPKVERERVQRSAAAEARAKEELDRNEQVRAAYKAMDDRLNQVYPRRGPRQGRRS